MKEHPNIDIGFKLVEKNHSKAVQYYVSNTHCSILADRSVFYFKNVCSANDKSCSEFEKLHDVHIPCQFDSSTDLYLRNSDLWI